MRPILFRGKRVNNGEWVEGSAIVVKNRSYIGFLDENDAFDADEVIPETVGQYTGLQDKNGNRILEGDIVKYETNYYGKQRFGKLVVTWDNDIENESFGCPSTSGYCIPGFNWEVIGNKWDNADKLEAQ